jgi:hypothetical protein
MTAKAMTRTVTMIAWATLAVAPAMVGAQASTATNAASAAPTTVPLTCDCPIGDTRGDLRNLAAFAPLGLLGVMAAAGGTPGIFAARTDDAKPTQNIAANPQTETNPGTTEVAVTERARSTNTGSSANPESPATGVVPSVNRGNVPDPVSPDSLRAGLRAPNTGTPLPSVFLLGTGLIAVGCVTVLRTRS